MAGQRSMIIVRPASMTRWAASSSMTPSWNQTTRAPAPTASSANGPTRSERTNMSTTSGAPTAATASAMVA